MKSFKIITHPALNNYPVQILKMNSKGDKTLDVSFLGGNEICEVIEGNEALLDTKVLIASHNASLVLNTGWSYKAITSQGCSKCTKYEVNLCKLYE